MAEPTLLEIISSKLRRKYIVNAVCENCDTTSEVHVPKGITIAEYLNTSSALCSHCGCSGMLKQLKNRNNKDGKNN